MNELTPAAWEQRYQEKRTGWDLGQPAPPFVDLLNQPTAPKPGTMAVLGSGYGYDAVLFAEHGFEVMGFDYAPSAIATANKMAQGKKAQFRQQDIFELVPEFANSFQYVLEYTCFCAIQPNLRSQYVELVANLLQPKGELIALFWTHDRLGGPPFGSSPQELHQLFEQHFEILSFKLATNSIRSRENEEYLARLQVLKLS